LILPSPIAELVIDVKFEGKPKSNGVFPEKSDAKGLSAFEIHRCALSQIFAEAKTTLIKDNHIAEEQNERKSARFQYSNKFYEIEHN
jgi:hypothetical protein